MIAAPDMKNVETSNRSYEAMSYPFTEEVAPLPIPREELPCSHQESLACMASICHHMGQPATVMLVSLNLLNKRMREVPQDTALLLRNINEAAERISHMLRDINKLCESNQVVDMDTYSHQD